MILSIISPCTCIVLYSFEDLNFNLHCFCITLIGVRSVEFNEDMLSFGTGEGNVYFYDLRAGQYLSRESSLPTKNQAKCSLRISKGYLVSDHPVLHPLLLVPCCMTMNPEY